MRGRAAAALAAAFAFGPAAGWTQDAQSLPPPAQAAPPPPAAPTSVAPPVAAPPPAVVDAPPEEGDAPPPAAAPSKPAPPAPASPPPEPLKRTRTDAAILQATDKITAETLRFQAKVGAPVRWKDLVITVQACDSTAADEPVKDSIAHLDVVSRPAAVQGRAPAPRLVFRGWMFARSPGLHPFEHPVYDLWLIACSTAAPSAPAGKR